MSLRILALIPEAFGGYGGIALYNRDFLRALVQHPACESLTAIPRLMADPTETIPPNIRFITTGLGGKVAYLRTLSREVLSQANTNLIISGHINFAPLAYMLGRYTGAPVLTELYGIDAWQPTASSTRNYFCKKLQHFVSISDFTKQRFLNWTQLQQQQVHLLPNAIHLNDYGMGDKSPELLQRYGLHNQRVIMTLGRLITSQTRKGVDEVLDVFPTLLEHDPTLCYLVVGDGSDLPRFKQKAHDMGLASKVKFAGRIPDTEKADHYRLADAFVMPGYQEGFGFVFLEALACGIPVVASSVDGSREAVLDGELGVVVDPRDPVDLKTGILKALATPKGIPDKLMHYSFENFSVRLHHIIDKISTHQQSPAS